MKFHRENNKIALAIGNSRLHWGWLQNDKIVATWQTPHLSQEITSYLLPAKLLSDRLVDLGLVDLPVYIASVVPQQTSLWSNHLNSNFVTLQDVPLKNTYPTMGVDRALAVWGGGETYGYPCLVVDGGTALTLTGVNSQKEFIGGAILPGLRSQFLTLQQKTAALPQVALPKTLLPRWAKDTNQAIASGIVNTVIAGIHSYLKDWLQTYPQSQIIFTGGDGAMLAHYLNCQFPELAIVVDLDLVIRGMMKLSQLEN